MKAQDRAEVIYLMGARKAMLEAIDAKLPENSKIRLQVLRCAECEWKLYREVIAESGDLPGAFGVD